MYTAYFNSPVGLLLIKADDEYIRVVHFVHMDKEDAAAEKQNNLQISGHVLLQACIVQLNEYFTGIRRNFELPLQQDGSEFQLKVWEALAQIPYGSTLSYLQLSKQINNVKAIRAVGTAMEKITSQ